MQFFCKTQHSHTCPWSYLDIRKGRGRGGKGEVMGKYFNLKCMQLKTKTHQLDRVCWQGCQHIPPQPWLQVAFPPSWRKRAQQHIPCQKTGPPVERGRNEDETGEQGRKRRSCIPITKEDNTELLKSKHSSVNYWGLPTLLPSGAEVTVITQRVNLLCKQWWLKG